MTEKVYELLETESHENLFFDKKKGKKKKDGAGSKNDNDNEMADVMLNQNAKLEIACGVLLYEQDLTKVKKRP